MTKGKEKRVEHIINTFIDGVYSGKLGFFAMKEQQKTVESIILRYGTNETNINKFIAAIENMRRFAC